MTQNGRALRSALARLKNDPEIVMVAVTQNGTALEYASGDLQDDLEIVLAAVAQKKTALYFASAKSRVSLQVLVPHRIKNSFNVSEQTFLKAKKSTGFLANFPEDMLEKIKEFAGVRSGKNWDSIAAAAANLNILITP